MSADSVRCQLDIRVVDGKLEDAIRELKRLTCNVRRDLKRRQQWGWKPSEKRRNKRWFAPKKRRWPNGDDELESARRDQQMYTRRAELERSK
jgi:ribosomal protein S21